MPTTFPTQPDSARQAQKLKALTREQIQQINEFLTALGDFGEIHLIVQKGELRYINKLESHKVWSEEGLKGSAPGA